MCTNSVTADLSALQLSKCRAALSLSVLFVLWLYPFIYLLTVILMRARKRKREQSVTKYEKYISSIKEKETIIELNRYKCHATFITLSYPKLDVYMLLTSPFQAAEKSHFYKILIIEVQARAAAKRK